MSLSKQVLSCFTRQSSRCRGLQEGGSFHLLLRRFVPILSTAANRTFCRTTMERQLSCTSCIRCMYVKSVPRRCRTSGCQATLKHGLIRRASLRAIGWLCSEKTCPWSTIQQQNSAAYLEHTSSCSPTPVSLHVHARTIQRVPHNTANTSPVRTTSRTTGCDGFVEA